ncbi:MAG: hypothetical protein QOK07_49 [Gemmatimonadaceae bacterium]|nr:hypothetical protein [Gemmatimonadaceae bacterium]
MGHPRRKRDPPVRAVSILSRMRCASSSPIASGDGRTRSAVLDTYRYASGSRKRLAAPTIPSHPSNVEPTTRVVSRNSGRTCSR